MIKRIDSRRDNGMLITYEDNENVHVYFYGGVWNKNDLADQPSQIIGEAWFNKKDIQFILDNF